MADAFQRMMQNVPKQGDKENKGRPTAKKVSQILTTTSIMSFFEIPLPLLGTDLNVVLGSAACAGLNDVTPAVSSRNSRPFPVRTGLESACSIYVKWATAGISPAQRFQTHAF